MLTRLNSILDPQISMYPGQVTKYIHDKGRAMATGTKRNEMIRDTSSEYFVFVDDDDIVPGDYIQEIMKAITFNPDVITFNGYMTTNGRNQRRFEIKLGSEYYERGGVYYRWPNHITVMKRELVQHIKFPDVHKMEDFYWSKMIHDKKLLKNEIHLDRDMYVYDFWDPKPRA